MNRGSYLAVMGMAGSSDVVRVHQAARRAGFVSLLDSPFLKVFGAAEDPHLRFGDEDAIILGRIFDRGGSTLAGMAPAPRPASPERLMEQCWGRYLAFFAAPGAGWVARDPSGGIGCYYRKLDDAVAFASDARLLAAASGTTPSVEWEEVQAQLQYVHFRTERTALAEILELMPGTCLTVEADIMTRRTIWSPYRFAARWDRDARLEAAAPELRSIIQTTVSALARPYRRPLVKLSGGLDSSIVTAALATAGSGTTCLALRSGGADLDETHYAEAVARRCGAPLEIGTLDIDAVALTRSAAAHLPRPTTRVFAQADDALVVELAQRIGADAFFSGGGGDNVFWYLATAAPALDRLRRGGPFGAWSTLGDLGRMTGVGRGRATQILLAKLVQRGPRPWPHDVRFLAPDAQPLVPPGWHPWLPAPRRTLPGVKSYVRALVQMQDHFEHGERQRFGPILAPLLAQPIVEHCLGIPSWLWCQDGRDRAVARAAFADRLPAEILARRTKGGFDGFVARLLNRNRKEARDMLMDGLLARQGLLDREAIGAVLGGTAPIGDKDSSRLLRLTAVEAWLRSWS